MKKDKNLFIFFFIEPLHYHWPSRITSLHQGFSDREGGGHVLLRQDPLARIHKGIMKVQELTYLVIIIWLRSILISVIIMRLESCTWNFSKIPAKLEKGSSAVHVQVDG